MSAKEINIRGNIIIGTRALYVDENGKILELIPNSFSCGEIRKRADEKGYRYVKLGSSSRFAVSDNKIFGYYGLRKFYHVLDDDKGVLVFRSICKDSSNNTKFTKERFENYVKAAKYLLTINIFPKIIGTCKVNLDCDVTDQGSKKILKMTGHAMGLITERLEVPQYDVDITNRIHRKALKRAWNDKYYRPYWLNSTSLKSLYGDDFLENNPLFRKKEYLKFCKKIRRLYKEKYSLFKKVSVGKWPPETKYGDVVYCVKNRQWFFGDLE